MLGDIMEWKDPARAMKGALNEALLSDCLSVSWIGSARHECARRLMITPGPLFWSSSVFKAYLEFYRSKLDLEQKYNLGAL